LTKKTGGFYMQARETEDIGGLLRIFLTRIGTASLKIRAFPTIRAESLRRLRERRKRFQRLGFFLRRPLPGTAKIGSQTKSKFRRPGDRSRQNGRIPEFADFHAHLPRLWARLRIEALVREMDRDGEREDFISEIIALSQKYRLVSPYTAFLAAPRALLRPRLIQPGDPVIRVKTGASVTEVFAVLPFGETVPLTFWPIRRLGNEVSRARLDGRRHLYLPPASDR
jgi:Ca-activated chloride channel family protein